MDGLIDNYRAVTLICTTYRILANILYVKLVPYADEIIRRIQRGFRLNFYCETNIEKMLGTNCRCTSSMY